MQQPVWTFGATGHGASLGRLAGADRQSPAVHDGPGAGGHRRHGPARELCDRASHPRRQSRVSRGGHVTVAADAHRGPGPGRTVQRGYGYALFPDVGKAGLGVGGAYGRGVVYERGQPIGYSDLTQGTVGAQAGGQSFSELLVFEHQGRPRPLQGGPVRLRGGASAVVLKSGVATNPNLR